MPGTGRAVFGARSFDPAAQRAINEGRVLRIRPAPRGRRCTGIFLRAMELLDLNIQ